MTTMFQKMRIIGIIFGALIILAVLTSSSHALAEKYMITNLGTFPEEETFSNAYAINFAGHIVGNAGRKNVEGNFVQAFIWDEKTYMQALEGLEGLNSSAFGINNVGQIVGWANTPGTSGWRAFLYSGGVMTDLGTFGGEGSMATGINDLGQVVGFAYLPGNANTHAFLYSGGVMTDLGTIGGDYSQVTAKSVNNASQVVGAAYVPGGTASHAFLYSGGVMIDLNSILPLNSGWMLWSAEAINDSGQIVGIGYHMGVQRAFLLTPYAEVSIDIQPKDDGNVIDLRKTKRVSVAILSTADFSASTEINAATLTFGVSGNENSLIRCAPKQKDVNGDSLIDLTCSFTTRTAAENHCGVSDWVIKGRMTNGTLFKGEQSVLVTHCN